MPNKLKKIVKNLKNPGAKLEDKNFHDGRPIQIVKKSSGGKLEPNIEEIKSIFNNEELQELPICVYSISGKSRTGKSFFLNKVLSHLDKKNKNLLKEGFVWKGGTESTTMGIYIWSKPIIIEDKDSKVAIFLIDNEGSFDKATDLNESATIFMISTILSSLQIYNIQNKIDESDLDNLTSFAQYNISDSKFQELHILIRDWQHISESPYGLAGGRDYLKRVLDADVKSDNRTSRENLKKSFTKITCTLMPHPGDRTKEKETATPEFEREIENFVNEFFKPGKARVKLSNEKPITCGQWLVSYINLFNKLGGFKPDLKSICEANEQVKNLEIKDALADELREEIEKRVKNEQNWKSFKTLSNDLYEEYEEKLKNSIQQNHSNTQSLLDDFKKKFETNYESFQENINLKAEARDKESINLEIDTVKTAINKAFFEDENKYINSDEFQSTWLKMQSDSTRKLQESLFSFPPLEGNIKEKYLKEKEIFLSKIKTQNDQINSKNQMYLDKILADFKQDIEKKTGTVVKIDEVLNNWDSLKSKQIEKFEQKGIKPVDSFTGKLSDQLEEVWKYLVDIKTLREKNEKKINALFDAAQTDLVKKLAQLNSYSDMEEVDNFLESYVSDKMVKMQIEEEHKPVLLESLKKKATLQLGTLRANEKKRAIDEMSKIERIKASDIDKKIKDGDEINQNQLKVQLDSQANEMKIILGGVKLGEEEKAKLKDEFQERAQNVERIIEAHVNKLREERVCKANLYMHELLTEYSKKFYFWRNPNEIVSRFLERYPDMAEIGDKLLVAMKEYDSNSSLSRLYNLVTGAITQFGPRLNINFGRFGSLGQK